MAPLRIANGFKSAKNRALEGEPSFTTTYQPRMQPRSYCSRLAMLQMVSGTEPNLALQRGDEKNESQEPGDFPWLWIAPISPCCDDSSCPSASCSKSSRPTPLGARRLFLPATHGSTWTTPGPRVYPQAHASRDQLYMTWHADHGDDQN